MKKLELETKRSWNWKVFLVLVGLVIPAAYAIVPFSVHQINAYSEAGTNAPGWQVLVTNALIDALIVCVLGGIGLLIANHIGLGMPFVESWVKRNPAPSRFRNAIAIGGIVGLVIDNLIIFAGGGLVLGLAIGSALDNRRLEDDS